MGQSRRSRKKALVISSDDDDTSVPDVISDDEQTSKKREAAGANPGRTGRSNTKPQPVIQPPTTRTTRRQTKPAAEPERKRSSKPIFSFFNAATQRQQASSQASASPPRSGTPVNHLEDIQDDISGDDAPVTLSRSSQTAQTLRKRKLHKDQLGQSDDHAAPPATQKFRKISDGTRFPATADPLDSSPWTVRFAPVDLSELAVHKRKVSDVRNILESALSDHARPRLIVLKGAAGTAKTTTVSLLAKDMGLEIVEWKNPLGTDPSSSASASASSQFEDFVLRSGKFGALDLVQGDKIIQQAERPSTSRQIMLVEEFPNTFAKTSPVLQAFRNTIQQFLATPASHFSTSTPLVMIISEALLSTSTASADSFTAHRLLGPQILNHPQTAQIEFNNIAPTFLIKALDTIVIKEARKSGRRTTPGPGVLRQLAETGDIRSAVSSLEFMCLCGDDGNAWSARVVFTKPKGGRAEAPLTKREKEALKLVSNRESSLGIFHAVGRVVHNKRVEPPAPLPQPPTHFPQHRKPKVPERDPDSLIDEIGTDTSTFIAALHENYALSCSSSSSEDAMDSLNGCIDALSDSDLLSLDRLGFGNRAYSGSAQDTLRQDDMSFQTAVRGLLFWLPSPVNRTAGLSRSSKRGDEYRMFYPSSLKLWKQKEELEGTLENVISLLQNQSLDTNTNRGGDGVESWHRRMEAPSSTQNSGQDEDTEFNMPVSIALLSTTAKSETLLDRLPYSAQILPFRKNIPQRLISGIETLTHMTGSAETSSSLEEDADLADDNEVNTRQTEWTDRPDEMGERQRYKRKKKQEFEGQGLHIPVEHAIEKLVLSDDDIEDD